MFHVGQKVVCVDDSMPTYAGSIVRSAITGRLHTVVRDMSALQRGAIYTVRGFAVCWDTGVLGIHVEEISREKNSENEEVPFGAWRFRRVVSRPTSIEVFTRMLTPNQVKETVS